MIRITLALALTVALCATAAAKPSHPALDRTARGASTGVELHVQARPHWNADVGNAPINVNSIDLGNFGSKCSIRICQDDPYMCVIVPCKKK